MARMALVDRVDFAAGTCTCAGTHRHARTDDHASSGYAAARDAPEGLDHGLGQRIVAAHHWAF